MKKPIFCRLSYFRGLVLLMTVLLSVSSALASPVADEIDGMWAELSDIEEELFEGEFVEQGRKKKKKDKKKKKKKKKNKFEKPKAKLTIKMSKRRFVYNRKIKLLSSSATIRLCNKSKFFYEPLILGGADELGTGVEFGPVRRCVTQQLTNSGSVAEEILLYDTIHPNMFAPFCQLPARSCVGAELAAGLTSCITTETCCGDSSDNDGDGLIDCDDSDCSGLASCDDDEEPKPGSASLRVIDMPFTHPDFNATYFISGVALVTRLPGKKGLTGSVCVSLDNPTHTGDGGRFPDEENVFFSRDLCSNFNGATFRGFADCPPSLAGLQKRDAVHWIRPGLSPRPRTEDELEDLEERAERLGNVYSRRVPKVGCSTVP